MPPCIVPLLVSKKSLTVLPCRNCRVLFNNNNMSCKGDLDWIYRHNKFSGEIVKGSGDIGLNYYRINIICLFKCSDLDL